MGKHLYCYFTAYQSDIDAALQALREAEFKAGRYSGAIELADPPRFMLTLDYPPNENSPAPGPAHASIEAALDDAMEDGTGSILDLLRVAEQPGIYAVSPVGEDDLRMLFGTMQPSREQVESVFVHWKMIGDPNAAIAFIIGGPRGEGYYIVVYDGGQPSEIFFFGNSFD